MTDNSEMLDYWNGDTAKRWVTHQAALDRAIGGFGDRGSALLAPNVGESIVDIGCGAGSTTLRLAQAVGPTGSVLGLDPSGPMLARAREVCAAQRNTTFVCADASVHQLEPIYHALFSRFGIMFFSEPAVALRSLRQGLKPGGRLVFVCWQALSRNAWLNTPLNAILPLLPQAPEPATPHAPGPFAFADERYLKDVLLQAGFEQIRIQNVEGPLVLSDQSVEAAVEFCLLVGPCSRLLKEQGPELQSKARDVLRKELAQHSAGNCVSLGGATWLVSARQPS